MAKLFLLPGVQPDDPGESLVVNYLKSTLPETYTLIPNLELQQPGKPAFEYDLVVVAPHAIYVVEVKRWLGGITGDDYSWLVNGIHRRQNPWPTANNKARVLKSQISERQPSGKDAWVQAVVTIADDQGRLDLRGNARNLVVRYTELPALLMDPSRMQGKGEDLRSLRVYVERAIVEAGRGRRPGPLRYGHYEVVETLSRRDQATEFLAKNLLMPNSPSVRLRVFSYIPYLPDDERKRQMEAITREAEALQRIGSHPNLIPLRGFMPSPDDPNLLLEITDWWEGITLRTLMGEKTALSLERNIELAVGIASGLKAAHAANVVHRDLRPENILISPTGQPVIMNFEHARLLIPSALTLGPLAVDPDVPQTYIPPELVDPSFTATQVSDLYSFGCILFEMLVGQPPYNGPHDARSKARDCGGPLTVGVRDIPERLDKLICELINPNVDQRPHDTEAVLEELIAIQLKPSGTSGEEEALEPPPGQQPILEPEIEPAIFQVGSVIDRKYQVQKVMNEGGSGRVYRVYDGMFDCVYALKVYNSSSFSSEALQKEARTLLQIDHPNIVKVYNWGTLPQSGRLYLVSDFVEGQDLVYYTHPDHRLSVREAAKAVIELLSALEAIHPKVDRIQELRERMEAGETSEEEYGEFSELRSSGFLHRDIKPANLILSPNGLKLIDFNIAGRASEVRKTFVGTPGYMLPEVGLEQWDVDGDLFATGVVLYELITGHHPYPDNTPSIEIPPTDPHQYVPDLSPIFTDIVLRAVSVDRNKRFHSARKFRQTLLDLNDQFFRSAPIGGVSQGLALEEQEENRPNYNPYVTRLLKLYSQARKDNSGTRGLDDVARLTYVETRLDRYLRPAILDGQYRMVIITGNAGDGKTAFIQNLEAEVARQGGKVDHPTPNSSRFIYKGAQFITNYDGSQDEGDQRVNDQVLTEFFTPFADDQSEAQWMQEPIHLIAINEGRLVDFFAEQSGIRFHHLGENIQQFFNPIGDIVTLPRWLYIVDLNQRSIVARDADFDNTSIFDRQLMKFLKPEFWAACQNCAYNLNCPIKYNVDTFSDPISGPAVRERLRTWIEVVHLRRQLHITMRDLRSALSWLLLRDQTCDDIALYFNRVTRPRDRLKKLYYTAFAPEAKPVAGQAEDRLVRLLRQVEPSEVANPGVDRVLHFNHLEGLTRLSFEQRSTVLDEGLAEWHTDSGWSAAQKPYSVRAIQEKHAFLRRVAYFERRDGQWMTMLPYHYLEKFRDIIRKGVDDEEGLKGTLARGFSFVEGARHPKLSEQYVCIRAGQQNKVRIKSFRLFPIQDFRIEVPVFMGGRYLEHIPDRILFYHNPKDIGQKVAGAKRAELVVSLDLLELLSQIQEGYIPSPDDQNGIFINLMIFKNALAHLPYDHVLLTRDDKTFYEIDQEEFTVLNLRRWQL
jgi:serine/threonine protein kinase